MGFFDFLKQKELAEIAKLKSDLKRYDAIINIDKELASKYKDKAEIEISINSLNESYKQARDIYANLKKDISIFESKLDVIEFGIYEPVYDFSKSEAYKVEQSQIIDMQKAMIQGDRAAICSKNWTVEGSESKGRAVITKYKKLMLRAFNGECDALISKVKWNNVNQMKERMRKVFETLNKLGEGFFVSIHVEYLHLKQKELILEYEYQSKRQEEKDELRRIQDEIREEEKAKREYEQAQKEAEKEEATYQKALDKARKEIEDATGEKHNKLLLQIDKLEQELKEAHDRKERALSMAQQTRSGHVYIISNIGSFGDNVYKIGMTRRLEPIDRVKELGDASVPFQFDIHAMIYSEDAPALENYLHKAFDNNKVNMVNYRKEFFNVSIDEIERKIKETDIKTDFIRIPEAMEYRETLAIIDKLTNQGQMLTIDEQINTEYPDSLI